MAPLALGVVDPEKMSSGSWTPNTVYPGSDIVTPTVVASDPVPYRGVEIPKKFDDESSRKRLVGCSP
jgi:hypothetical protein